MGEWKCRRGGLHELRNERGILLATIERGAETRRWWWATWPEGDAPDDADIQPTADFQMTLGEAKADAEEALGL